MGVSRGDIAGKQVVIYSLHPVRGMMLYSSENQQLADTQVRVITWWAYVYLWEQ